jgi:predicted PhzF superfamily epimerase YddE/YHI9
VFLDGAAVPEEERQQVATDLGFSETVFVDDADTATLQLFTPATELPFAGHPMVGTAWLLHHRGRHVSELQPPAGAVGVRFEGDLTWISARPEWAPDDIDMLQLQSPEDVDELRSPPGDRGAAYCWAWEDEDAGQVRSRGLYPSLGIDEDEATGAAAITLSAQLDRPLVIRQGLGSLLRAHPGDGGRVEVGGITEPEEVREYEI